jgi:hypothetical protein
MRPTKEQILDEIRRTAGENGGAPFGYQRFAAETGIREHEWKGRYWVRWSDAVREAGFTPNQLNTAYQEEYMLEQCATLARALGHIPVHAEMQLASRNDSMFPSYDAFTRLGTKAQIVGKLAELCRKRPEYADLLPLCEGYLTRGKHGASESERAQTVVGGYVYLIRHGSRREYKIGRTNNALRREGEITIELPEKVQPVHVIVTDDPSGIEAYWHKRFDGKRKNGEWFELSASDVAAFKKWRRIF